MPVFFEDQQFIVRQSWLGGWRVIFKPTRVTLKPNTDQAIRMGFIWKKLREKKYRAASPPGNRAEDVLFLLFAYSVLDPKSDIAISFLGADIDQLALMVIREANIEDAAQKL